MNRFKLLNLFLPALLAITSTAVAQPVMYVDVANTSPGSGNSWGACKNDLANAIQTAFTAGTYTEIRVAKGTYKPGTTRASTFFLLSNVSIKGGFPGRTGSAARARRPRPTPFFLSIHQPIAVP